MLLIRTYQGKPSLRRKTDSQKEYDRIIDIDGIVGIYLAWVLAREVVGEILIVKDSNCFFASA